MKMMKPLKFTVLAFGLLMLSSCVYTNHDGYSRTRAVVKPVQVVVEPQVVVKKKVLPRYYQQLPGKFTTFHHAGVPYYHCNNQVYRRYQQGFAVVVGIPSPRTKIVVAKTSAPVIKPRSVLVQQHRAPAIVHPVRPVGKVQQVRGSVTQQQVRSSRRGQVNRLSSARGCYVGNPSLSYRY